MAAITAREIAELVHGRVCGDPGVAVCGVAGLDEATADDLSFLANVKYTNRVTTSAAGIVLVPADFEPADPPAGRAWVECENPNVALSVVAERLLPPPPAPEPGVHPDATVAADVQLGAGASVGPRAVLAQGVVIGDNSMVEAGCYIGPGTTLGADCRIYPNVTIRERCRLGDRVIIHSGAVIGSDGYGYEPDPTGQHHLKLPQLGIVQIDDDVEIGACTTVDRARFGRTWIQRQVKIDNLVQVAHNVTIGEGSFLMSKVGLSGSCTLGRLTALFGDSGVPGHTTVGDGARLLARAVPFGDVPPGAELLGFPAQPQHDFMRQAAALKRLPKLQRRVRELERQLAKLAPQDGTAAEDPTDEES